MTEPIHGERVAPHAPAPVLLYRRRDDHVPESQALIAPLVGREREVAAIEGFLRRDDVRLFVLTGPGGVGKTRLAMEIAESMRPAFAGGTHLVRLAAVRSPGGVLQAIADGLDLHVGASEHLADALVAALQDEATLLILDNFEHILPAAPLITDLLARCPRLKALVTSRSVLGVYHEQDYPLPPLSLPDTDPRTSNTSLSADEIADSEAVRLFVARAQAVRPGFTLTDGNARGVAAIVHQLDGLPLALELAAAGARVLSPDELATVLRRSLPLLRNGSRDLPTRFSTMRDAIAWSYDLLGPDEQALLRRFSVFVGGLTLDAAAAIDLPTGARDGRENHRLTGVIDGLMALVEQSLVQRQDGVAGASRFSLLETIREFARDELNASGEADEFERRHAHYFLDLVERAARELTGPDQAEWLARLEADHANLQVAFDWLRAHDAGEEVLRFAAAVWRFGYTRGYVEEARRWLDLAFAMHPGSIRTRAVALNGAGILAAAQGDLERAEAFHRAALDYAEEFDDLQIRAVALNGIGDVAAASGRRAEGIDHYQAARSTFQQVRDDRGIAATLTNLANVYWDQAELGRAVELHEAALELYRAIGEQRGIAWSLGNLGRLAIERGDAKGALPWLRDGLAQYQLLGDRSGVAEALEGAAEAAVALGDAARAATLLGAADELREWSGVPVAPNDRPHHERVVESIRRQLGTGFEAVRDAGRLLSLDEAVGLVDATVHGAAPTAAPAPADGDRPRTSTEELGLTPREVDVLGLLSKGKSDREIADALFVSTRTVQTHLAHLYGKLGVNSRAGAAALAVREHLVE